MLHELLEARATALNSPPQRRYQECLSAHGASEHFGAMSFNARRAGPVAEASQRQGRVRFGRTSYRSENGRLRLRLSLRPKDCLCVAARLIRYCRNSP